MNNRFKINMSQEQFDLLTNQNMTTMDHMIAIVRMYIFHKKHIVVNIESPRTDKDLQLLGRAYDVAYAFFSANPQFTHPNYASGI
jgi:hypothetical protein